MKSESELWRYVEKEDVLYILEYLGISWNSKDLGMQASVFKILKNIQ